MTDSDTGERSEGDDAPAGSHESMWMATTEGTSYAPLDGNLRVDTVVVGGGIVGVTAASRLEESGQTVAIVERDRILTGTTGYTTAKLTSQHGLIYDHLVEKFGEERAALYGEANETAIDAVESTVEERGIDCDFQRTAAYTYTTDAGAREKIRREADAAKRVGLPASYTESTDLPFDVAAAVRFDDQAHYHPRAYLLELAESVDGDGSHVFERTVAQDVDRGRPCRVETDRGTIAADDVIVASHFPFYDHGLYFARLSPKRSYVLAARLGEVPEGMYYRDGEPYFSVRPHPAGEESMALIGGQNHRTGHGGSEFERYRKLERAARAHFDVEEVVYRWSTQDFVSVDRVPFVGKLAPQTDHVYVATGFGGWGMSNGIAAGHLLADLVRGRPNAWRRVYSPSRLEPEASLGEFVDHNAHAIRHFVEDRILPSERGRAAGLSIGEARIVDGEDGPLAVYRDESGGLHTVSAVCTHMGCTVHWNDGEESWDCPCHGSRFGVDGEVLDTPAVEPLEERPFRSVEGASTSTDGNDRGE